MIKRISVVVVTKNEATNIKRCLDSLHDFDDVWVVDSHSTDETVSIAQQCGAKIVLFDWNGQYPKKRQWCLNTLDLRDFVLFVDADEVITSELLHEIKHLNYEGVAGFFIQGRYVSEGKMLRYGMCNNKLCLINRNYVEFPIVHDLDVDGMGEIEGHYQPVLKEFVRGDFLQLRHHVLHYACDDKTQWLVRHKRYAHWQTYVEKHNLLPHEVLIRRQVLKRVFRALPLRHVAAFVHSYVLKFGFLDGVRGFKFAMMRARYYQIILHASKDLD